MLPLELTPASASERRRYMDEMLASGEIAVTATARSLAGRLLGPPVPYPARPLLYPFRLTTAGLLSPALRQGSGLAWDRRRAAELALFAAFMRRTLPLLPSPVRHWPAARAAERRAHRAATRREAEAMPIVR